MEEKKQPPAPPPKAHRGTLSKANLPVNSGKTEVTSGKGACDFSLMNQKLLC